MSQQPQPTSQQSQQHQPTAQGGQQFQQAQGTGHQGVTTNNTLPDTYWTGLTNVAQAIVICEFCADQCIQEADPMMTECIKLCEDVADIGKSVLSLVPHESRNAQPVLSAFERAIQACAQECGQHQHAHCQECAQVLTETLDAIPQLSQGGMGGGMQGGMGGGMQGGASQSPQQPPGMQGGFGQGKF